MDVPLHYFDEYLGDRLYANVPSITASLSSTSLPDLVKRVATALDVSNAPRDSILRQSISLYLLTYVGILLLYFGMAGLSYYFIFDHRMKQHPRYLKDQVKKEIMFSLRGFPVLDALTLPWFVADVRGLTLLYDTIEEGPFGKSHMLAWAYMAFSVVFFLVFTDTLIYLIHAGEHHPLIYKRIHKPHHKWVIPTPFASHAFHPLDGYAQSLPYHMCLWVIPIHKYLFIGLFVCVNLWSIFIHDSDMLSNTPLISIINGPAHHTLHHLYFTVNYGQYFTTCDKFFGSFRAPAVEDDPLLDVLKLQERKKREVEEAIAAKEAENKTIEVKPTVVMPMSRSTSSSGSDSGRSEGLCDSGFEGATPSASDKEEEPSWRDEPDTSRSDTLRQRKARTAS